MLHRGCAFALETSHCRCVLVPTRMSKLPSEVPGMHGLEEINIVAGCLACAVVDELLLWPVVCRALLQCTTSICRRIHEELVFSVGIVRRR